VVRYQTRDFGAAEQLVAEHGFSALVSVEREGDRRTVLYDAGLTAHAVARNLDVLQVPVDDLRAIVISHGHADHHGGLEGLIRRRGRSRLPLVIHPDAWRERRIAFPSGGELRLPPPSTRRQRARPRLGHHLGLFARGRDQRLVSRSTADRGAPGRRVPGRPAPHRRAVRSPDRADGRRAARPPASVGSCPRTAQAGGRSTRSPVPCPRPSSSAR
jgi:glyoxylase-like metal-dependent hydrolase (beta-lactamase superfamily II)